MFSKYLNRDEIIPKIISFEQNFPKSKNLKRPYSIKLFSKMIIEKCQGDFCESLIMNNNQ